MTNMLSHLTSRPERIGALVAFTLLAAVVIPAAPALAATGEACPNEAVRAESNTSPLTGQLYDMGLPECRAYEMVSPLEKQQHDALKIIGPGRISVSPEGSAIEWTSEGAYAGAENYQVHSSHPANPYVAQRTASGWVTRSGYPPINLIEDPEPVDGSTGVYSPNLADETVCGGVTSTGAGVGPTIRCALRDPTTGVWTSTPEYTELTGEIAGGITVGASRTGEDIVFYGEPGVPFLPSDTSGSCQEEGHCGGIYEEAGVGSASPELRLVNVDNNGEMIGPENTNGVGDLFIDAPTSATGSDYQAVSADGSKIFFTATPSGGVPTIYARIDGEETVSISNPSPSECTTCSATPQAAVYQGASADGSKVFFTTDQQLLDSGTGEENALYEYDFNNPPAQRIVKVSGGGLGDVTPGANAGIAGVVSVSEDGSHVYFVAGGVLTTLPNGLGQTASASPGSDNLYTYDTDTGETKFVATLLEEDKQLWGFGVNIPESESTGDIRQAQATPDGRYLVFDSYAKLITAGPEADTSGAQQVYRYDFQTGNIIRVSVGHEGFANNGNTPGFNAVIGEADFSSGEASSPTVNDSNRAISENGETIAFISAAQLQSTDIVSGTNKWCGEEATHSDAGCEVYVWHDGAVNMISDGQDPAGAVYAGMSGTGSDIFFQTRTQLVGQDTDHLGDIYDARIGGGFPAPPAESSCAGEACQGSASSSPAFGAPGTASFSGGVNLTPGSTAFPAPTEAKSKPLTRAQKLTKALKSCKKDKSKSKRKSCEKQAKKQYGAKPKPKK
jgi:hypothetical protein